MPPNPQKLPSKKVEDISSNLVPRKTETDAKLGKLMWNC